MASMGHVIRNNWGCQGCDVYPWVKWYSENFPGKYRWFLTSTILFYLFPSLEADLGEVVMKVVSVHHLTRPAVGALDLWTECQGQLVWPMFIYLFLNKRQVVKLEKGTHTLPATNSLVQTSSLDSLIKTLICGIEILFTRRQITITLLSWRDSNNELTNTLWKGSLF